MSAGKYRKENNCLNCGFHVEKHYCSSCGQPNLELNESFWQFISHSVAHYFHFDNKFFQTLVPLISKPGKVTLDYLAGKRARYINPVSMYIFVSLVYFLVVYSGKEKKGKEAEKINKEASARKSIIDSLKQNGIPDSNLIKSSQAALAERFDRKEFRDLDFKQQTLVLKNLKSLNQIKKSDSLNSFIKKLNEIHLVENDSTYATYLARQQNLPSSQKDNVFERYMKKRSIEIGENGEFIQEQLEHHKPKVYFLFMPLMAFFVMLNFRKNNIRYLDHLIFTIHGMTAFFLVSIIIQPAKRFLFPDSFMSIVIETALITWICWYLMRSLKIFYQRKTSTTIWRTIWIIFLYGISIKLAEIVVTNIIYYVAT